MGHFRKNTWSVVPSEGKTEIGKRKEGNLGNGKAPRRSVPTTKGKCTTNGVLAGREKCLHKRGGGGVVGNLGRSHGKSRALGYIKTGGQRGGKKVLPFKLPGGYSPP